MHKPRTILLEPTRLADRQDVQALRPHLGKSFRTLSGDDLSCLGIWLISKKEEQRES